MISGYLGQGTTFDEAIGGLPAYSAINAHDCAELAAPAAPSA